jgi:hypothetical protein
VPASSITLTPRGRRARMYAELAWTTQWLRRETTAGPTADGRTPQDSVTRQMYEVGIAAAVAQARGDTLTARPATDGPPLSPAAAALLEIGAWRRSALDAADSVHHSVVLRISASFDSARASRLSQDDLLRALIRLNRINDANESAWFAITGEIDRMADSATVANGGAPHPARISNCVMWHLVLACRGGSASDTPPKPN